MREANASIRIGLSTEKWHSMPISDHYVIQFLLQATRSHNELIRWEEKESEGYVAIFNNVRLEIDSVASRTGSRLYVSLSYASKKSFIAEPHNSGVFREKYEDDEQRCLAHRMMELARAVACQCAARNKRNAEPEPATREAIYKRLIGPSEADSS